YVGVATSLKLIVAPIIAAGIVLGIGFVNSTVGRVFVLEAAMPSAITPLILTIEFGSASGEAPEFVSTTILVSTLLSLGSLTLLITILRSGIVI
ncbi:MAG: AEC family transporter, partial [Halobacteriaceae archaeon]